MNEFVLWGAWVPGLAAGFGCLALVLRLRAARQEQATLWAEFRSEQELQCQAWDNRQEKSEQLLLDLQQARQQQDSILGRNGSVKLVRQEVLAHLRSGLQPDAVSKRMELPRNEVRLLARVQGILAGSLEAR